MAIENKYISEKKDECLVTYYQHSSLYYDLIFKIIKMILLAPYQPLQQL